MLIKKVAKLDNEEIKSAEVIKDVKDTVCNYLMNRDCNGCPFECSCDEWDNLLEQMIEKEEIRVED